MRKTFVNVLTELSRVDDKVMCVIGDTGFSVFEDYEKEFNGRFINVGIAEQNFISFGAGLAAMGMKPFLYNVVSFMWYRAFEQIELDICYQENPVVLVGVGGGHAYGTAGPTHHGYFDLALSTQLPNMKVYCPADPVEMKAVMYEAYRDNGPSYIRIGRSVDPVIHDKPIEYITGKPIIVRYGVDTVIIATGTMVKDAIKAHEILKEYGISCAVYSLPSIKPIEETWVMSLCEEYSCIFTLEEHSERGGLGDAILNILYRNGETSRLHKFGFPDTFAPVTGSRDYLNSIYGIDANSVAKRIKEKL